MKKTYSVHYPNRCTCAKDNFLDETFEFLKGHKCDEVLWVGTRDSYMSWEDFLRNANFLYDSGFGTQEIRSDLQLVGKDWWAGRTEYDGYEEWQYYSYPAKPEQKCNAEDMQKFLLQDCVGLRYENEKEI